MHTYRICQVKPYVHLPPNTLPHMVTSLCVLFKALLWPFSFSFFGASVTFNESTSERQTHTHTQRKFESLPKKLVTLGKRPWRNPLPSNRMATCP
jgi:hypothetical protein